LIPIGSWALLQTVFNVFSLLYLVSKHKNFTDLKCITKSSKLKHTNNGSALNNLLANLYIIYNLYKYCDIVILTGAAGLCH